MLLDFSESECSVWRMATPQETVESFLREKAAMAAESNTRLAPVHAKYFGEPLLKHARDFLAIDKVEAMVAEVSQSLDTATVITREQRARNTALRKRYRLSLEGRDWKIISIEWECFVCNGTGASGQMACHWCGGEGWWDHRKEAP